MIIESLGFVEVRGAANAIAVADAMIKASNVRILSESRLDPGQVTIVVEGDLGACQAAIEVGAEVAKRHNCLVGVLLKGKPDVALEKMFQQTVNAGAVQGAAAQANPQPARNNADSSSPVMPGDDAAVTDPERESDPKPGSKAPDDPMLARPRRAANDLATDAVAEDAADFPLQAVVDFIAAGDNGRTMAEITGAFGVNVKTARAWVQKLIKSKRLVRFNRGVRVPSE